MKKRPVLIAAIMLCTISNSFAQYSSGRSTYRSTAKKNELKDDKPSRWKLGIGIGYAGATAGQTFNGNGYPFNGSYTITDTVGNYKYDVKNASFGAGLKAMVHVEYLVTDHVGITLGAQMGFSNKKFDGVGANVTVQGVPSDLTVTTYAKMPVMVMPGLVLQTGGEKVNVYMRMALVLPVLASQQEDVNITTLPGYGAVVATDYSSKQTNSFSLGYSGSIGAEFRIADHFNFFVEGNVTSLSMLIKKSVLQSYMEDGVNYISYFSDEDKKITYSKQANTANNNEQVSYSLPYSSMGINVGFSVKL